MMCFSGQTAKVFNSGNERFGGKIISNDMKIAENRTFAIHTSNTNKQRERVKRRNRENHIGIGIERSIGPVIERDRSIRGVIENVMLESERIPDTPSRKDRLRNQVHCWISAVSNEWPPTFDSIRIQRFDRLCPEGCPRWWSALGSSNQKVWHQEKLSIETHTE